MFLASNKVRLVRFTEDNITPEYLSWLNDQQVNRYMSTGRMPVAYHDLRDSNSDTKLFFAIMTNLFYNWDSTQRLDQYKEYIGTISLHRIDWINRTAEIGYMIGDKRYWGKGIATEAVGLVSDYAFNRLNLHKVEAGVTDGNVGSISVLKKNKFIEYARIPEDCFLDGKYLDTHRFYKLQSW